MRQGTDRRFRCARGVTLVEVAVSVAIMGGVITGILVARARAFAAQQTAESTLTCVRLCSAKSSEFRAGLAFVGEGDFDSPKGFHWIIRSAPLPDASPQSLAGYEVFVHPAGFAENGVTAPVWINVGKPAAK